MRASIASSPAATRVDLWPTATVTGTRACPGSSWSTRPCEPRPACVTRDKWGRALRAAVDKSFSAAGELRILEAAWLETLCTESMVVDSICTCMQCEPIHVRPKAYDGVRFRLDRNDREPLNGDSDALNGATTDLERGGFASADCQRPR